MHLDTVVVIVVGVVVVVRMVVVVVRRVVVVFAYSKILLPLEYRYLSSLSPGRGPARPTYRSSRGPWWW